MLFGDIVVALGLLAFVFVDILLGATIDVAIELKSLIVFWSLGRNATSFGARKAGVAIAGL